MKKIFRILVISIFILSLLGIVFAQAPVSVKSPVVAAKRADVMEDIADAKEDIADAQNLDMQRCIERCQQAGEANCLARCRAADIREDVADAKEDVRESRRELLMAQKFARLSETQKAKLQTLSQARLQKIEKLSAQQIEKINALEAPLIRRLTTLNETKLAELSNLDEESLKKLAVLNSEKIKAYSQLKLDQLKTRLQKLRIVKINANERFVKRQITAARLSQLKADYDLAKQKYMQARNEYRSNKEKFLATKARVRACYNVTTEECKQLMEDILEQAKDHVNSIIDTLITHLEKLKNRIESSEALSEEKAEEAISEIDELIGKLNDMKSEVDAATTKEELREAISDLNRLALQVRLRAHIRAVGLLHDGIGRLISLAELAGEKADCSIAQLEEEGVDVTELDAMLDEYNEKIEAAKADFEEAKDLLLSGTETAADDAKEKIKEARDKIREANKLMLELRQEIRANGGKVCQKAEITIAEETEEES